MATIRLNGISQKIATEAAKILSSKVAFINIDYTISRHGLVENPYHQFASLQDEDEDEDDGDKLKDEKESWDRGITQ